MKPNHRNTGHDGNAPRLQESRTARGNLAVHHPARWRLLKDLLISPPMRLHRYRSTSARLFEDAVDELDFGKCCHE